MITLAAPLYFGNGYDTLDTVGNGRGSGVYTALRTGGYDEDLINSAIETSSGYVVKDYYMCIEFASG